MKHPPTPYLLLLALLPVLVLAQGQSFRIEGQIAPSPRPQTALLLYTDPADNAYKMMDSVRKVAGEFSFKGTVVELSKARLFTVPGYNRLDFYAEPGLIRVQSNDSLSRARVQAGEVNRDYDQLQRWTKSLNDELWVTGKELRGGSPANQKGPAYVRSLEEKIDSLKVALKRAYRDFLASNPDNLVAGEAIEYIGGFRPDPVEIRPLFDGLSARVRESTWGQRYASKLKMLEGLEVGQPAPDFTQTDTLGRLVALHDYRGRYVLVDFWASWCGPCRKEHPSLIKAYTDYRDRNFTILSVSLDETRARAAWLKAIAKDGLLWTQVSDLKGWDNEASRLYGIEAIPSNYLIGPDGRILARNLRGEALHQKLSEVLPR